MIRFKRISSNKEQIDKDSFQQNMGILGLKSAYGFSDRLFNSFDIDKDGKVTALFMSRSPSRTFSSTWKYSNQEAKNTKPKYRSG